MWKTQKCHLFGTEGSQEIIVNDGEGVWVVPWWVLTEETPVNTRIVS